MNPRRKMAAFVSENSGAVLEPDATIDFHGNVVVCGHPRECRKVREWATGLGLSVEVERPLAEDPEWTVCRIAGLA